MQQLERTLGMATRFLDEVRGDIGRAALEGADIPPRLRSVHEKPGHATPEFRTVAIPVPDGMGGVPPDILSGTIARYAETRKPDCLLLAMEAELDGEENRSVLIAEARDRSGTRMYWMQPYRPAGSRVDWDEPLAGGWADPGEAEMILDAAFPHRSGAGDVQEMRDGAARAEGRRRRDPRRQPHPEDREIALPGVSVRAD